MSKLWQDIVTHKRAAVLFLAYWLAILAVVHITWNHGIRGSVVALIFSTPLVAGALVGSWRVSTTGRPARFGYQIKSGMLAALLCIEITFLVMKGAALEEVLNWVRGDRFEGDQVLALAVVAGVIGIFLGLAGALLATMLHQFRQTKK